MKGKFLESILALFFILAVAPVFSAQLPPDPGESVPPVQIPPKVQPQQPPQPIPQKVQPQQPPQPAVPAVPVIPGRARPPTIAPQVPQAGIPGQPGFPTPQFTPPVSPPERRLIPQPASPSGGMVSLNFTRADLVEIIHIIAQHLRLTYTIDPEVKGTVTINSADPLRTEDLLPIFHQILRMNGAVAVRTGNLYNITTLKDGRGLARPRGQGSSADSYALQVVPVRFFSVAEMKRVLQPFVMPGGELLENPRGNFLIIVDIPANIQRLVEIADLIDVQIFAGTRMEIYQPKVASAEELAQEMTKVMQSFASSAPQADSFTAQFLPLPRINQLLVISHSEAAWTYARRWLERIDVVAEGPGRRIFIYPVENGKAGDLADVLSQALGLTATGTRSQMPTLQSLHSGMPGASGQQSGSSGSSSSSFGQPGGASQQQRPFGSAFATIPLPGQPASPTAPTTIQPSPGTVSSPGAPRPTTPGAAPGAKPEEHLRIVADVGTNSLIIYGTAQEFQNIKNILKDLDAIPRQVLIEALIFQVDLKDTEDFGVNYQILNNHRTTFLGQTFNSRAAILSLGSALLPTGPGEGQNLSRFVNGLSGIVGDDTVKALIRALATDSRAKILSAPSVLASDNRPARIQVGTEEPIATGSVSSSFGTPNNTVSNSIQYRNTGRIMTIIPQVNSQGLVNLQIKAEVSARGDDVTVGDQKFPSFNTQDAETSAVVHDGETLVIGGLIGEIKTKGRTGLPYLMDLPVVGRFFGSTSETSTKTELIMLITPRVIRNREESRIVSEAFKNKLNTVRNELERLRADEARDQERQRRLRQPLPAAPSNQIPQGEIPVQPTPPAGEQSPAVPSPVPAPTKSGAPVASTIQPSPAKQMSAPVKSMNPITQVDPHPGAPLQFPSPTGPHSMAPVGTAISQAESGIPSDTFSGPSRQGENVSIVAMSRTENPAPVVAAVTDPIENLLNTIESKGAEPPTKMVAPVAQPGKQAPVWVVQVASFGREADALSYASILKTKGYDANVATTDIAGKTRYRVEVGPLATRNDALAVQKNLRTAQRIEDSLVISKLPELAGENR